MNEQTTIDRMQENGCQGKSCLYLGRLMKRIVSKDFRRAFIWCFFTTLSLMLGALFIMVKRELFLGESRS